MAPFFDVFLSRVTFAAYGQICGKSGCNHTTGPLIPLRPVKWESRERGERGERARE